MDVRTLIGKAASSTGTLGEFSWSGGECGVRLCALRGGRYIAFCKDFAWGVATAAYQVEGGWNEDEKVHDPNRINFTERYLLELEKATDSGTDIRGYFHWTFMDNVEWTRGCAFRSGMVYVDYQTQERIIKDSGYWYKKWIEEHS